MVGLTEVVRAVSPGCGGICRVAQMTNHQFLFIYFFSSQIRLRHPPGDLMLTSSGRMLAREKIGQKDEDVF